MHLLELLVEMIGDDQLHLFLLHFFPSYNRRLWCGWCLRLRWWFLVTDGGIENKAIGDMRTVHTTTSRSCRRTEKRTGRGGVRTGAGTSRCWGVTHGM